MTAPKYTVRFKKSAAKEFRALSKALKERVSQTIEELIVEPRVEGVIKLKGSANLYRVRIGDYRMVYEIDDEIRILHITRIRHRRDVYR